MPCFPNCSLILLIQLCPLFPSHPLRDLSPLLPTILPPASLLILIPSPSYFRSPISSHKSQSLMSPERPSLFQKISQFCHSNCKVFQEIVFSFPANAAMNLLLHSAHQLHAPQTYSQLNCAISTSIFRYHFKIRGFQGGDYEVFRLLGY
jgi:hypothetical protein